MNMKTQDDQSIEKNEALLRSRARALASRSSHEQAREIAWQTIVVGCAGVRLALPVRMVVEIRRVHLTPLPGLPPSVLGVFQIRGRLLSLIDPIGNRSGEEASESPLVAVVESGAGGAGLLIDEIIGPRTFYDDERADHINEKAGGFITFVSRDLVQVLDVPALLRDRTFRNTTTTIPNQERN